jgi:hypothetical protein
MGQPFYLFVEPAGVELLHRLHDAGVKCATALVQHTAIRHLVGERVLEGVLEIRE